MYSSVHVLVEPATIGTHTLGVHTYVGIDIH